MQAEAWAGAVAMQLSAAGQLSTYSSLAHPSHTAASLTAVLQHWWQRWGCPHQYCALEKDVKGCRKELQELGEEGCLPPRSQDKPHSGRLSSRVPGGSDEDGDCPARGDLHFLEDCFTTSRGRERPPTDPGCPCSTHQQPVLHQHPTSSHLLSPHAHPQHPPDILRSPKTGCPAAFQMFFMAR